mmetsp:Transcript_17339/g.19736  ORF Transcript_17339/g.19736 Transcript_17339/m.19736 type:complete len:162 (+) Transcript_17339:154-639(+)
MSSETKGKEELLMLYDGKCNVCNWAVQFSLNRIADNAIMRYASLQSEFAAKTLKKLDVNCFEDEKNPDVPTTSAVIHRGKVYTKLRASVITLKYFRWPWPILAFLISLLPNFLGEKFYDWFASNRFRFFGGTEKVQAIPKEKENLFLDKDEGIHVCPLPSK